MSENTQAVEIKLNAIEPAKGSKKNRRRVGRGIGCGLGKTCGRGHKGQRSRTGGYHKVGFEGGQMPMQRRLPKIGFVALHQNETATIRLGDLNALKEDKIDLMVLRHHRLIRGGDVQAKVVVKGTIERAVHLSNLLVSKSAKEAIEKAGGSVTLAPEAPKVRKLPKKESVKS